jgi:hypothetical protein
MERDGGRETEVGRWRERYGEREPERGRQREGDGRREMEGGRENGKNMDLFLIIIDLEYSYTLYSLPKTI